MRLIKNPAKRHTDATVAQVSFSDSGNFGAVGASEVRGVPVFAPRGIAYQPCEGDNLLILPVDGADTCVGVLASAKGLAGGELRLCSAGGAEIVLRNDGEIVLNGVRITRSGEIVGRK